MELPAMATASGKKIIVGIASMQSKMAMWIEQKAGKL
jgi:hypothetical protein